MRLLKEIHELFGSYHLKSGIYHFHRDEFAQAVKFLRKALENSDEGESDESSTIRFYLTQTYLSWAEAGEEAGEIPQALEACHHALEFEPGFPDLHFRLGRLLERTGENEEAAASYCKAAELNPEYIEAHRALGFLRLRTGAAPAAAEAFGTVHALAIAAVDAPYRKGIHALTDGDAAVAEQAMREAFLRHPDLFEYHYRNGLRSLKAGDFEDSCNHLASAAELGYHYTDLYNYLGVAYAELERTEEAIAAFKRSIEGNPEYLAARLNLGFTYAGAGLHREAVEVLTRALELQPSLQPAKAKLEELRANRKDT